MIKKTTCFMIALCLASAGLSACSGEEEKKVEETKSAVEKFTEETADKAVKKIKTPINKAREASRAGMDRLEEIEKKMNE